MDRMGSQEQMYELWMHYSSQRDIQLFKTYVDRFLQQYPSSIDLEFKHIAEGRTLSGPSSATLPDGLLETLVVELASCSQQCQDTISDWDVLQYATQIVQVLIATCRHHDNIALVGSCEYFKHIIPLAAAAFKTIPFQEGLYRELLVNFIQHSLHLLECMYDPLHLWRRHLSKHSNTTQSSRPALLSVEVVPFFYDCLSGPTWSTAIKSGLHCHVLHMFGAIVTGSKPNAQMATTPPTVDMLFRLLTSESDQGVTRGPDSEKHTVTELVLRCLVQMIKVIHSCSPEERQVELSELLEQLLQALRSSHRNSDVQYAIFRSIPQTLLENCGNRSSLQRAFVKADVFTTLLTILETATVSDGNKQLAVFFTVHLLGAILNGSLYAKEIFKETIGYEKLGELIDRLGSPSQELIDTLMDMVFDTSYKPNNKLLIQNTGVVSLLLFLLPRIHHNPTLQEFVVDGLAHSCVSCDYNRMQCCYDDIVSGVIGALQCREQLHRKTEERLIGLLESLGAYSITSSQLKTLIALKRGEDDQSLSRNCTRLMRALSRMARKEGKLNAHHYFDFQADDTGITIPIIKKWPGSSFSFHTWVCLNTTPVTLEKGLYRRQLYSFYTASGCGFEAFFTLDGVLVVAVCTRKEFFSVSLTEYPITDNNWHQVNIVHYGSKRPFVQSQLSIFVDGYLRQTSQLKFPAMGEPFISCFISAPLTLNSLDEGDEIDTSMGMRPRASSSTTITTTKRPFALRVLKGQSQSVSEDTSISMVPASMKYLEWGASRSLQGQMGSACVFYDTLTPLQVKKLYLAGPNVLTLFQVDDPDLSDLNSKVLIYYHGKACKDSTCMDLSRNQPYDGSLTGHSCSTGRLKDVLNCIGGVQVLFPLLELSLQDQAGSETTTPEEVESPTASVNVDNVDSDDWEILPTNMQCEAKLERNRISGFLSLLKNVCIGHSINQELLHKTQGLATIGALLQKAESSLIDVNVLMAVQLLVESVCAGSSHLIKSAHRHLLFDFRIWSKSDFPVRIGHIQYLATIIKDNRKTFRKAYGVQFMLDVIRMYYSGNTDISVDDSKAIRHSLRGLIRYYVYRSITQSELQCILGFITAVKEQSLIEEALDLLLSLMETPGKDQLILLLFEHGSADLLYVLLTRQEYSDGVQVRVLKLFAMMLHSTKIQEKNKTRIRLQDIGFSGLTLLMEHGTISMSVARTLVELVTEGHLNHRGLLAVLQVLHSANALVKLEACTQLLHILYTESDARTQIAKIPGWQDTLARLLVKTQGNDSNCLSVDMNGFFSTKQLQASESSLDSLTAEDLGQTPPMTPNHPPFASVSNSAEGFPSIVKSTSNGTVHHSPPSSVPNSDHHDDDSSSECQRSRSSTAPMCARPTQIVIDQTHCNDNSSPSTPNQSLSSWSLPISVDTDSIATESTLSLDTPDGSNILCVVDSGVSLTRPSDLDISSLSEGNETNFDLSPGGIIQKERNEQTLVDTLIESMVQIMWLGVEGSSGDAWVARGQIFKCIADLAGSHQMLRPVNQIKRQMLEKLLEGAAGDVKAAGGVSTTASAENALYLVRLVYDFLFGIAGSDSTSWSVKLEEGVVDLMDILQIWTDTGNMEEWKEMSHLGLRLLLRFSSHNDLEICAMASARLHHLIQSRPITSPSEACFFLGSLDDALIQSLDETDSKDDTFAYMIPLARAMVDKYRDELGMSSFLVNLPSTDTSPTFVEDFREYCRSDEWRMYIEKQVQPFMHEYITNNYSDITAKMSKYWRKCFDVLNTDIHKRERERGESKLKFTTQVIEPFNATCKTENARHASTCNKLTNQHQSTLRQWRAAKRFLIGERGAWAERNPQDIYWKLSSQENFSRMRLKLTQNYNYDQHIDASQQRDNTGVATEASQTLPLAVAKEARVSDMELQDDRLGDEEWNLVNVETGGEEQGETVKEKVVISEECQLITLVDVIPGKLDITTTHVYFYDTSPEKEEVFGQDFKWSLSHLREVHLRRYNLRRSAIEVFFINQTNYFINFKDRKIRNKAYSRILSMKPPNLYYTGAKSPIDLLKASGLTQKWIHREISNFDYLMQLNTIAGRTYNDLSQYPVFPWILSDYSSEELDLENPDVFRDLSKPIGVVNPKHIPEVQSKYENFEDPSGTIDKFHYGTHYSNAAGVMHYLVRMEPFTTLHIQLQSGRFDCADRQFQSIESMWDTLMENPNDVKELIPEFFYLPEFLVNDNEFDLGCLQTGEQVDDVLLPKWAKSPEDFIYKHRQALESDYVSSHLHHWIDLIFGYKQKGPAAVEALNVFYYCTYEGAVDLDAIKDDIQRQAVEGMINNFGQTPCQLLKEPHPQRRLASSPDDSTRSKGLMRTQPNFHNIFEHLDELKAFFVEASTSDNDPLVYVRVPKSQTKSFIYQGMPDTMVTVTQKGVVGTHSWLPYDKSISHYFTFDRDSTLLSSKTRKLVSGPFAPGIHVTAKLFVATHDARLLFVGGHWDNSLRVFNLKSSGRLVAHVTRHMDVITCVALDGCGMQLITGSRDTTCMVWEITYQNGMASGINNKPIQTLYGHDDEVTCVALSSQLDMAVSASKDGTIIVNTILKGHYIRTLRPPSDPNAPLSIPCLAISEEGHIIIHLRQPAASKHMQGKDIPPKPPSAGKPATDHCSLHLYSVNGKHLYSKMNAGVVTDMEVVDDFLLTSDSRGVICFRKIFELEVAITMRLQLPVHCLSVVPTKSQVLAGLRDGKLIIISIDRPPEARKLLGR